MALQALIALGVEKLGAQRLVSELKVSIRRFFTPIPLANPHRIQLWMSCYVFCIAASMMHRNVSALHPAAIDHFAKADTCIQDQSFCFCCSFPFGFLLRE